MHFPLFQVLRPVTVLSRMIVWRYYLSESLGDGPPYDGLMDELTAGGTSHNEQEAQQEVTYTLLWF